MSRVPGFHADCRVGRLIEARLAGLRTPDDVAAFQLVMKRAFVIAGQEGVICADWRGVGVLAPDVGEALIALLRNGNRHFLRSAVLLSPDQAIFTLQVERLIREARNPARRCFRTPEPLVAWLSEVLTAGELARAEEFLGVAPALARLG